MQSVGALTSAGRGGAGEQTSSRSVGGCVAIDEARTRLAHSASRDDETRCLFNRYFTLSEET